MRLFQTAKIIFGAFGAGLSNMIFADPGTTVIEVTTPGTGNFYLMMAAALGHRFYGYCVKKPTHEFYVEPHEFMHFMETYLQLYPAFDSRCTSNK